MLSVGYGAKTILSDIQMDCDAGQFICILGRNGAGKSTLMRTIAGLQPALAGRALLDGEDLAAMSAQARAQRIAVVVTERVSSPSMTVEDVVALGRQPYTDWHGKLSADDSVKIANAMAIVHAAPFAGRMIDDLSDGERQRVMIARAIAQTPRLMILDEITAFLDLPGRVEAMTLLRHYARDNGATLLLSSHDLDLSLQLADFVWLLDGHGAMEAGAPADLIRSGAIGRAFDTGTVRFSTELGRFEMVSA